MTDYFNSEPILLRNPTSLLVAEEKVNNENVKKNVVEMCV
jgi:hypothetical protein